MLLRLVSEHSLDMDARHSRGVVGLGHPSVGLPAPHGNMAFLQEAENKHVGIKVVSI